MSTPVDLRADGLLWLINRVVFHPRGFALGLQEDGSFVLLGDGTDCWSFTSADDDGCFCAAENLFDRARGGTE